MKEREFQGWILDVAARLGWRAWHVPAPMRPVGGGRFVPEPRAAGLPDLILLHDDPPRLIFAEVKGVDGKLSDEQREFLALVRGVVDEVSSLAFSAYDDCPSPESSASRALPIGVFTWRPGNEDLIETILRGKVMA
jgi:hypothetical protein